MHIAMICQDLPSCLTNLSTTARDVELMVADAKRKNTLVHTVAISIELEALWGKAIEKGIELGVMRL